jgi:regulatory protein
LAPGPETLEALRQAWSQVQSLGDEPTITDADNPAAQPMSADDPAAAAREIALRRLSVRARSRKELASDLKSRQVAPEIAEQVLDRFTEVGLIDDGAFAQEWVESRGRRSGTAKLRQELRLKGVSEERIAEATGGRADEDLDNARALATRKAASMRGLDSLVRQRRLNAFLGRRGFSNAVIRRVIAELLDAEPEPGED